MPASHLTVVVTRRLPEAVETRMKELFNVELRDGPSDGATVVAQAEMGVVGRILECQPGWCRVSLEGTRGWISTSAVWGVKEGEIVE